MSTTRRLALALLACLCPLLLKADNNPQPGITFSPTSLSFTDPQYRYGGTQQILVSTSGDTFLYIQSITLQSGGTAGFSLSTDCALHESNPIGYCHITVTFTPQANVQHYSDAIIVSDDVSGSPQTIPVTGSSIFDSLQFVPVTPCRVVDTRLADGPFGGPILPGGSTRSFAIPSGSCSIPSTALAYSLNVTAVPQNGLGYLTIWPASAAQPLVSTLNSDGRTKANAAIVPSGTNGAVNVFVTNASHVVLDINGYFVVSNSASALVYYPVTPCRLVDTRLADGPLAGPYLSGGVARSFPLLSGSCSLPAAAQAYSLNVTAVPHNGLGYLTTWPTGQTQPVVSTLNAPTGTVTANAAIVPAGTNGAISLFASNDSDVVLDVNGYFAPASSASGGLSLYTITPCRVLDSRLPAGSQPEEGTFPVTIAGSTCGVPVTAQAFVLNATVVPSGGLAYLTLWPDSASQPLVSTLNAQDGVIASNMAIVPTTNGLIDAFASNPTYLVLDISSYFAP